NIDLVLNYLILEVDFTFKEGTKYPCIPTRVDDDVDIYPLKGTSIITGSEYLVALSMGCKLYVKGGVIIPFKRLVEPKEKGKEREKDKPKSLDDLLLGYIAPFRDIVKDLQKKRRQYPKKTFFNYMYKEIGNSIYGQTSMGLSGKRAYSPRTNTYEPVDGGFLSNPILASYITGFTRALVGECLNNIQIIGGKVVSVTTDGFITDVEDLESKLLALSDPDSSKIYSSSPNLLCLNIYKSMRGYLTDIEGSEKDYRALEVKHVESKGLISWKTRGQLGFTVSGISAATGFQVRYLEKEFLIEEFTRLMGDKDINGVIEYIESGLRSATDIFKRGGHVIAKYKDKRFSLNYDDKRRILDENVPLPVLETKREEESNIELENTLSYSYSDVFRESYLERAIKDSQRFVNSCLQKTVPEVAPTTAVADPSDYSEDPSEVAMEVSSEVPSDVHSDVPSDVGDILDVGVVGDVGVILDDVSASPFVDVKDNEELKYEIEEDFVGDIDISDNSLEFSENDELILRDSIP
ncbi:hypothetical protein GGR50DRAFT_702051, partial [Xylaria sp. CBS 124048]